MQTQIRDFQSPAVSPQENEYQDEQSTHYGILVGGAPRIDWNGTGESSVGHHVFERRTWKTFSRLRVGRRPEFDGALDLPENTVQTDWAISADRLAWKSPRACAGDVLASFREQGFCVPKVLIGHVNPESLTEKVWPRAHREKLRLYQHIEYFESFVVDGEEEAQLAEQLLDACYLSRNWISETVRTLKTEVEGPKGLKNLNEVTKEYFYEINEPLPEHKTALVASAMGKEIVEATRGDGRRDDAMINALNGIAEGQRALASRLDKLETTEPRKVQSEDTQEGASDEQTPNTQPRRGPGRPRLNPIEE